MFLRLGATAFGGPAAHVGMMEDEVVARRGWVTRPAFLDLVAATNLIPGPNSTELAIHLGLQRAGWAGLVVAGTCFIVPAAVIVGVLAWAYVRFGTLPAVGAVMRGIAPVVIAIVAQALWRLGKTALTSPPRVVLALACVVGAALGVHELALLAAAGGLAALVSRWGARVPPVVQLAPVIGVPGLGGAGGVVATGVGAAGAAGAVGLGSLFLVFLKIGSVLFGSGYVLIAFLRTDLVERLHWLTEGQLLDAVAIGQVTPGPLFTTATFIGYLLAGAPGAVVATVGMFLPAFVFVALSGPLVPWMRRHPLASAMLDGVVVGSLALMAVVSATLARGVVTDPVAAGLVVVAGAGLYVRVPSAYVVLAGAVVGWLMWGW